jgi:hypothetical protein
MTRNSSAVYAKYSVSMLTHVRMGTTVHTMPRKMTRMDRCPIFSGCSTRGVKCDIRSNASSEKNE